MKIKVGNVTNTGKGNLLISEKQTPAPETGLILTDLKFVIKRFLRIEFK
jgi:hypothetical protein